MVMASTSARPETAMVSGVFFVHSCPRVLVPHVEWALAREIGTVVKLTWTPQPLLPQMMRTTAQWRGPRGTAAEVTSSLFGWQQLRFEITEESEASGGGRWMHTPSLGIFHTQTDAAGNGVLTENVIRQILRSAAGDAQAMSRAFAHALGEKWDRELDPFRRAEEGDATIFELPRRSAS